MTPRDRRAIILGGSGLAIVAVMWLIILPFLTSWSAARDRIDSSRARMEDLEQKTRWLIALDRQLQPVMGDAVKKPLSNLDTTRTQFIKDLIDLHSQTGAEVQSVQPEAVRPLRELPGIVRFAVQVHSTCQPVQLVQILAAARNSPSLLLIDRVEAGSSPQGPGALNVTMVWSTLARQDGAP